MEKILQSFMGAQTQGSASPENISEDTVIAEDVGMRIGGTTIIMGALGQAIGWILWVRSLAEESAELRTLRRSVHRGMRQVVANDNPAPTGDTNSKSPESIVSSEIQAIHASPFEISPWAPNDIEMDDLPIDSGFSMSPLDASDALDSGQLLSGTPVSANTNTAPVANENLDGQPPQPAGDSEIRKIRA